MVKSQPCGNQLQGQIFITSMLKYSACPVCLSTTWKRVLYWGSQLIPSAKAFPRILEDTILHSFIFRGCSMKMMKFSVIPKMFQGTIECYLAR